jgi:hypothetical protein
VSNCKKILTQQAIEKNNNPGRAIDFAIMSFQISQGETSKVKITVFNITFEDM